MEQTVYCRTCAKSDVTEQVALNWLDLFTFESSTAHEIQQVHTLLASWDLQVRPNDGLPARICDVCYAQFRSVFELRQRCEEAHFELERLSDAVAVDSTKPTPTTDMIAQPLKLITFECEWQTTQTNAEVNNAALHSADGELSLHNGIYTFDNLIEEEVERENDDEEEEEDNVDELSMAVLTPAVTAECTQMLDTPIAATDGCIACGVCGKRYADRLNLRHHYEKYHSDTDFECTLCEKRFNSRRSLRYHSKWHDTAAQLKCSHCDRLFISKRQLACHEQTHASVRNTKALVCCTACGKTFMHAKTLRWHTYRQHGGEKPVKCGNCTAAFVTYVEKRLHSLETHLTNLTAIERIECIACHERYANEHELIQHMRAVHGACGAQRLPVVTANSKRVLQQRLPQSTQGSGLLQCDECDKRFHMRSALERHRAVHSIEGRPHACSVCNKRFKRAQDRNWHLKVHATEKPNVCDVCGKAFALNYVLTQHRRSHDVLAKNFTCTECGRAYLSKSALRLHERIHTGRTFYKCDLCDLEFVTHIKLKYHMLKQHTNPAHV